MVYADGDSPVSYQWTHRAIQSSSGSTLEYQAVGHDISDRKAAEAALIEAKEAAESADRAKSEFLAVVSHEVRTPINAVIGFSKLLRESGLGSEQAEYVNNIHKSGVTLEGLIADILDVSRLEAGQLEVEHSPFSARECIDDLAAHFTPTAHRAGLKLDMKVDPNVPVFINGDQRRFRQVLMNLIGNALKFTDTAASKCVSVPPVLPRSTPTACVACGYLRKLRIPVLEFRRNAFPNSLNPSTRWMHPALAAEAAPDWAS